jgi:hypothetical protein
VEGSYRRYYEPAEQKVQTVNGHAQSLLADILSSVRAGQSDWFPQHVAHRFAILEGKPSKLS